MGDVICFLNIILVFFKYIKYKPAIAISSNNQIIYILYLDNKS